jgi:glycosyltransferase involved in cell wall biosynthesis
VLDGSVASSDRFALADEAREKAFAALLARLDVGAAHLHHLSGWPARVWRALAARRIPYAYSVHDYLCTCPAFYRLDLATMAPCACSDGPPGDASRCLTAFAAACGLAAPADPLERIRAQRGEFGALLESAAALIAPSEAARDVVAAAFPERHLRWHVIPHALPVDLEPSAPRAPEGTLRIALLGAPAAPWKGADAVLDVMRATRDLGVHWHVFGDADAHGFPQRAAEAIGAGERLQLHGRYARADVARLLATAAIDATLLLSPWHETFSYALSESWAAGVPAIVSDVGAPAARVAASGGGIVVHDAAAAAAALRRLAAEPATRAALAAAARAAAAQEPSRADNAARHRAAYGTLLDRLAPRGGDPPFGADDVALFEAHRAADA